MSTSLCQSRSGKHETRGCVATTTVQPLPFDCFHGVAWQIFRKAVQATCSCTKEVPTRSQLLFALDAANNIIGLVLWLFPDA